MKSFLAVLLVVLVACSSVPEEEKKVTKIEPIPDPTTKSITSEHIAAEQESSYFTEIAFSKGSTILTSKAKKALDFVYKDANKKGKIEEVKVITWADKEYPNEEQRKLADQQIELVDKRNKNIEKYLGQKIKDVEVKKISMAERPGALQALLSTENVRLKKSLETAGIPETGKPSAGEPKASKSIVIFILEQADQT